MPTCPHCGQTVSGVSERAAADIISQRDLLKVQKADLTNKLERQAAWIEKLQRIRSQQATEIRVLRDRLGKETGRTWFDREGARGR